MILLKKIWFSLSLILSMISTRAQRKIIDSSDYFSWPEVTGQAISNDGRFTSYTIHDPTVDHDTLILRSTDAKWQKQFIDVSIAFFSQDSKKAIFQRHDSIFVISLGNETTELVAGVANHFSFYNNGKNNNLLTYTLKQYPDKLVFKDLNSQQQRLYPLPERIWSNPDGTAFLFLLKTTQDSNYNLLFTTQKIHPW